MKHPSVQGSATILPWLLVYTLVGCLVGCSERATPQIEKPEGSGDIGVLGAAAYMGALANSIDRGPGGRAIQGIGAPYKPTQTTPESVNKNMATRRDVGWTAVGKVFYPYSATLSDGTKEVIPTFLSWYVEAEINDIMVEMANRFEIPTDSPGFTDDQIEEYFGSYDKRLREGPQDFVPVSIDTLTLFGEGIPVHVGTSANVFSPGFVTHVLKHMREIATCLPDDTVNYIQEKADGLRESFTPCMSQEFPRDAIMFKPKWKPVSENGTVDVRAFPTGPNTMRGLLGKLNVGEMRVNDMPSYDPRLPDAPTNPETPADPDALNAENFFVVEDSTGKKYALRSLHVVTKEIDEWIWASIWWSAIPNRDLGLDRPANFQEPLKHYKICVATTFMEQDAMPTEDRFPGQPELATVMHHATWVSGPMKTAAGTASWCANPYVEGGFHEQTCIGCHQPAGEYMGSSNVRNVDRHFGDFAFTFRRIRERAASLLEP